MSYVHGRAQQVEFDCETPETFCQKKKVAHTKRGENSTDLSFLLFLEDFAII